MRSAWLAVVLGGATSLVAAQSSAEPTVWQRARDPSAHAEARLLRGLERLLDAEAQAEPEPEFASHFSRAAVAMLDLARLPAPNDPRLACAMARALVLAHVGRAAEAERLLEAAIPKLPVGTLLAGAWRDLGRARRERGDAAGARAAWTRELEIVIDPEERGLAFFERAAAEVRLGELAAAALDYQRASEAASSELLRLRGLYGVALSLERQGDLPAALVVLDRALAAKLPLSHYPSDDPLEVPGGFTPEFELEYVRGLAATASARRASESVERRRAYEHAVAHFDAYLAAAPASDAWLGHARALRERAAAELRKLPGTSHPPR